MALTQASEGGLKISNAGTNGQYLQKQSGNTGGLTWADVPAGVGGSTGVDFNDSVKIRLGTGNDCEIFHDGTSTMIDNNTGDLKISSDTVRLRGNTLDLYNENQTEPFVRCSNNGSVELYYDNSKKLETFSWGIQNYGNVAYRDNDKLIIGDNSDLQIYHDGSNCYVLSATGTPLIQEGNEIQLRAANDEKYFKAVANGSVELYHNGNKKFETHQYGVDISGNVYIGDSGEGKLLVGAGEDLQIYHTGSQSRIENSGTGELRIQADTLQITDKEANDMHIECNHDGNVELYYDNSKKFETQSTGITVRGTDSGDQIKIIAEGTNAYGTIDFESPGAGGGWIKVQGENALKLVKDGGVELYHDNIESLSTSSTGIEVKKTASGQNAAIYVKSTNGGQAKIQLEAGGNQGGGVSRASRIDFVNTEVGTTPIWTLINDYDQNGTNDFRLMHQTEAALVADNDGAVELFYDGTKKFETQNTGCKVGGNLTVDGDILPNSTNSDDLGSSSLRFQECHSAYWIHRYGSSGSATQNQQEAIFIHGGIHFFGDYITMSNGNFSNGITGNRSYPALAIHQDGSGAAIHAEDGAITEASDYRIKENVTVLGSGIDKVKALKPITYTLKKSWKPSGKGEVYHGFIAHEVGETLSGITGIVCGEKDAMAPELYSIQDEKEGKIPEGKKVMDETGNMTTDMMIQSVDYGKLTPILTAALKEAIAKIETLETKVAALEAG